jgi:hypothetical protein
MYCERWMVERVNVRELQHVVDGLCSLFAIVYRCGEPMGEG